MLVGLGPGCPHAHPHEAGQLLQLALAQLALVTLLPRALMEGGNAGGQGLFQGGGHPGRGLLPGEHRGRRPAFPCKPPVGFALPPIRESLFGLEEGDRVNPRLVKPEVTWP